MTPVAALVSCVCYSWWSNWSYRTPLLACCVLLLLGNLVFASALACDALWMARARACRRGRARSRG